MAVFARAPGLTPGAWAAMVTLGILVALGIQTALVAREHLNVGSALVISARAIVAGAVGAKAWYAVLHRRERDLGGWCIQGFVLAAPVVLLAALAVENLPVGDLLDATAPALFVGMAIGRIGCFFAGCCSGRPTCARWGVWSSDQRVGVRRVSAPVQEGPR